jgi:protein-S-isoprenylcysteine O-methyltransferase Ste14
VKHLALTLLAFAFAAAVNTGSVAIQQRSQLLTRTVGSAAWYFHLGLISPPWIWFLALLRDLEQHVRWPLPDRARPLGSALLAAAGLIWLVAFRQLGPARVANGNFFGRAPTAPVAGGIFRWLRDPMYDAYALAFIGAALRRANAAYLLLAAESLVLLNGCEASVENRPLFPSRTD